jgi:hypothetical protein
MSWLWTGGSSGDFNNPVNWSPNGVPSGSGDGTINIPAGDTVLLQSNVTISYINIVGTGTATIGTDPTSTGGPYTLTVNNNLDLSAGQGLNLSNAIIKASSIALSGTGTSTISGGTFDISGQVTVATGQNLVLANATYTSTSGISGAGTFTLNGSTLNLTSTSPAVAIYFDNVSSGGASNTLNVASYASGLILQNLGYGDILHVGGDTLTLVSNGNGTYTLNDTHGGSYTSTISTSVTLAPGATPADFTNSSGNYEWGAAPPCFCMGTLLATADGEIAVESLSAGMLLKTFSGEVLPVRWVGHREVSTRFGDPLRTLPIRIMAGALADNLPTRDLLVSPDHALFLGGVLIQAGALVNGISILREENMPERFAYYHVELASHELLLAEGAAAESFVDNVNRMNFNNWAEHEILATAAPIAEMDLPRAKSHRQVPAAVRATLEARLALFGEAAIAA